MHRTYKDNDIVTKHLAECFVYLCAAGLASQAVSELRLYHVKGRLHIASLVIALHELLLGTCSFEKKSGGMAIRKRQ
jgi:hypothetical protein